MSWTLDCSRLDVRGGVYVIDAQNSGKWNSARIDVALEAWICRSTADTDPVLMLLRIEVLRR